MGRHYFDNRPGGGLYPGEVEVVMSGSKRKVAKRNRRINRIVGFTAVGLAIAGLVYVLNAGGCI